MIKQLLDYFLSHELHKVISTEQKSGRTELKSAPFEIKNCIILSHALSPFSFAAFSGSLKAFFPPVKLGTASMSKPPCVAMKSPGKLESCVLTTRRSAIAGKTR
jgi:hypothetical protein